MVDKKNSTNLNETSSVGLQSVIFNNNYDAITKSLQAVDCAARYAKNKGSLAKIEVFLGDCSPSPCLTNENINDFKNSFKDIFDINYLFFNKNYGSAEGHNQLAKHNNNDIFIIQNPDIIMSPTVIDIFCNELKKINVGIVEAKQMPIEHPKDYNSATGETMWAATACVGFPKSVFEELNGFDSDTFFLYCDDVDFSWRVRAHGLKLIFQPAATVYHDKRLGVNGGMQPTDSEKYYSAEAALLLAWKWSHPKLAQKILNNFIESSDLNLQKAASVFLKLKSEGKLPVPIDSKHKIGQFMDDGNYAQHRYIIK